MLSYICDVAVAVVAVMAEIHFIPSVVSGTSAEIAVQSVAVPVVDLRVHPFFAVRADAVLCPLLPYEGRVHFVNAARKVLVD